MPLKFDKQKLATPVDPARVPYITKTAEFKYQPESGKSYDYTTPDPSLSPQAPHRRPSTTDEPAKHPS